MPQSHQAELGSDHPGFIGVHRNMVQPLQWASESARYVWPESPAKAEHHQEFTLRLT